MRLQARGSRPEQKGDAVWSVPNRHAIALMLAVVVLWCRLGLAQPPAENDGAAVYKARCARCHGESGKTDTSVGRVLKVAPLVDDPRLARMTPEEIARLILSDPKHQGVVELDRNDVEAAAVFVKRLAAGR